MISISTTLPFRGDRNYLHGTTLFSLLAPLTISATDIVFRINRVMTENKVKVFADAPFAELNSFPCTLTWEADGKAHNLVVIEDGNAEFAVHEPYDDAGFLGATSFGGSAIGLQDDQGLTFIETAVALNKALLKHLFPQSNGAQYVFTRLELAELPTLFLPMRVQFFRRIGANHFMSRIYISGENVGAIHFSLWVNKA